MVRSVAAETAQFKPLRILFLQTKEDESIRMDPFFRNLIAGASESEFVSVAAHWGPGYARYNSGRSLRHNIAGKYGDAEYFDVVFTCGADVKSLSTEYIESRVVVAMRKHECRPGEGCFGQMAGQGMDIIALVNPFEIATNAEIDPLSRELALVHIFSPTSQEMYKPVKRDVESGRPVDLLLAGTVNEGLYPLRQTWRQMFKTREDLFRARNLSIVHKGHPGHFQATDPLMLPSFNMPKSKKKKKEPKVMTAEYIAALHSAKILCTDSAKVHYSLQKYTEALISGTLIIADSPHDRMREFRKFIVEVPSGATPAELGNVSLWWAEHEEARLAKTRATLEHRQGDQGGF
jgi:hypothetical protein